MEKKIRELSLITRLSRRELGANCGQDLEGSVSTIHLIFEELSRGGGLSHLKVLAVLFRQECKRGLFCYFILKFFHVRYMVS